MLIRCCLNLYRNKAFLAAA